MGGVARMRCWGGLQQEGCKEGWKNGCILEGAKGGLQKGAANARCMEGFCNGGSCKRGMQHGVAMGRGAMMVAKRDACKRGAKGVCKRVLQMQGAWRGFAMEGVVRKGCSTGLQ